MLDLRAFYFDLRRGGAGRFGVSPHGHLRTRAAGKRVPRVETHLGLFASGHLCEILRPGSVQPSAVCGSLLLSGEPRRISDMQPDSGSSIFIRPTRLTPRSL